MKVQPVPARRGQGLNMSLHPRGPKWTIWCGECPGMFRVRIGKVNRPHVRCPHCLTWNRLNLVWTSE